MKKFSSSEDSVSTASKSGMTTSVSVSPKARIYQLALQATDLREGLDDGERGFGRAPALQDRGEHVEPLLREGLVVVFRMGAPVCAFGL